MRLFLAFALTALRDCLKQDSESFILDYFSLDWEHLLKTDELNTDT